jgi:hypothetical protein
MGGYYQLLLDDQAGKIFASKDAIALGASLHEKHGLCDEHGDMASAGLLKTWIDEAGKRTCFLFGRSVMAEPFRRVTLRQTEDWNDGNMSIGGYQI